MHHVTKVRCAREHTLVVTFEDGRVNRVDLGPYLHGGVFEKLQDAEYFRTARLDVGRETVVWDNGANFPPDFLYDAGRPVIERRAHG